MEILFKCLINLIPKETEFGEYMYEVDSNVKQNIDDN